MLEDLYGWPPWTMREQPCMHITIGSNGPWFIHILALWEVYLICGPEHQPFFEGNMGLEGREGPHLLGCRRAFWPEEHPGTS